MDRHEPPASRVGGSCTEVATMNRYPNTATCWGELLERFEPTVRDTDVFTATVPKCGQTWLMAMLHHLRTRGDDPNYGGRGLLARVPWLELSRDPVSFTPLELDARLEALAALEDPRVFKMHVAWEAIPRPAQSKARIITITRDPRDVPYSFYEHLIRMRMGPTASGPPPPFEAVFEQWLASDVYGGWLESFWPHRNDPDLLWLRYEDMQEDAPREARRILEHLGWRCSDSELLRAVDNASFASMRDAERDGAMPSFANAFREPFMREGAVGSNRGRLSSSMEARIVDHFRERFGPEACAFVFAQGD